MLVMLTIRGFRSQVSHIAIASFQRFLMWSQHGSGEQDKINLEHTSFGVLHVLRNVCNSGVRGLVVRHAKKLAADLEDGWEVGVVRDHIRWSALQHIHLTFRRRNVKILKLARTCSPAKCFGGQHYSLRAERQTTARVELFDRFSIRLHVAAVDVSACEPVHVISKWCITDVWKRKKTAATEDCEGNGPNCSPLRWRGMKLISADFPCTVTVDEVTIECCV